MGVTKGALGPCSPYLIFILCRQLFCQLCRKIILVIIRRKQSVWLLICYFGSFRNSVWLLLVKKIWQPWFRSSYTYLLHLGDGNEEEESR